MRPNDQTTWILVADASRARLFSTTGPQRPWKLVEEMEHPESRHKGIDLMADRPGRTQSRMRTGRRAAMEPDTDPREVEAMNFAQQVAQALERGLNEHAYARLVIAAAPHFLGLLRQKMSEQVAQRVVLSIDKDYAHVEDQDLPRYLAVPG
ncbi:MAG: host attachment protein [Myxococcales bacterium]|nr:host attachment protein [Myxococcales bacterium]